MLNSIFLFISCCIIAVTIFFVLKKLTNACQSIFHLKTIALILTMAIIVFLSHNEKYTIISPIVYFLCVVLIYKEIFDFSFAKAGISSGITIIIILLSDVLGSIPFALIPFVDIEQIRTEWIWVFSANVVVSTIAMLISSIRPLNKAVSSLMERVDKEKFDDIIVFIFLVLLAFSGLLGNVYKNLNIDAQYIVNFVSIVIFAILLLFYVRQKNHNNRRDNEYNLLLENVEVYEDEIENNKLSRHELKNTLGAIRNMTKSKSIISKIDGILNDVKQVDDKWLEELKNLPKSPLKALLYYKMSVAKSKEIHTIVDVSPKVRSYIKRVDESKDLCNLLGIYIDNAIEAAQDSNEKEIAIEIYLLKESLYFVVSNTYRVKPDIEKMNRKGFSSKGKNRGNGLYYAAKIISKYDYYSELKELHNHYYIQKVILDFEK